MSNILGKNVNSSTNNFYLIRDDVIPNNKNIKILNDYLEANLEDMISKPWKIETLYGSAISANNILMISTINLFVRENNIKINKSDVLEQIYYADCRTEHSKFYKQGCLISFLDYRTNDKIQCEYIQKYWSMFN